MKAFASAVVFLLLATPGSGHAQVAVSGDVGVLYGHDDTSTPATSASSQRVNPEGSLQGSVSVPQLESSLLGAYRLQRVRVTTPELTNDSQEQSFSGELHVLDPLAAPVSFALGAGRGWGDSTTTAADVAMTGARKETSYDGTMIINRGAHITVGASQRDSTAYGFAAAPVDETSQVLRIGTRRDGALSGFGFSYEGQRNSGSLEILDYTANAFRFDASVPLGSGTSGFMTGSYYQRAPETVAAYNPRFQDNNIVTGVRTTSTGVSATYTYDHRFFSSLLTGEQERIQQSLSGSRMFVHSPSWQSTWTLGVSMGESRIDGLEDRAYGATIGGLAIWRHSGQAKEFRLEAGPTLGFLKDAGADLATGAHFGGHVDTSPAARCAILFARCTLGYTGDYARNVGVGGWSLGQTVTADAEGALALARGHATLSVSTTRQHDAAFSTDSAARDVLFKYVLEWRRVSLHLDAGLRDGTTPAVGATQGDGLFIPSAFDSHSQFAGTSAAVAVTRSVSLTGQARYARLSGPEVVAQQEASFQGGLRCAFGQIAFSAEDRYSVGGPGFDTRVNLFMLRASRSFGARF